MSDSQRSLLAAFLSVLVLLGWHFFFGKKFEPPPSPATTMSQPVSSNPSSSGSSVSESKLKQKYLGPEVLTSKETPLMQIDWTNREGRPSKIFLKKYLDGLDKKSPPTNLLPFEGEKALSLLCDHCNFSLPADAEYRLLENTENSIVYQAENGGVFLQKKYTWAPDRYVLNLQVLVENRSSRELQGRIGLAWHARQLKHVSSGFLSFLKTDSNKRTFLYKLGNDVTHFHKDESQELQGTVPWAGIEDRYFLTALISRRVSSDQTLRLQKSSENSEEWLTLSLLPSETTIIPQSKHEETFSFYVGPKERSTLQQAGVGLEEAVDYGWFGLIAVPILKLLQIFHSVVKNWGLAVILLTLFVKILMNPLTIKSMKQMKGMQKLQPQLAALKEKYKNDKQRLNLETMQLFKANSVNPMGGCLPMVMQMPIYIALYKVLYNSIELYHAPFVGFYKDLAAPDPYFILPVLLGIFMVLQQKMTPSPSADPTQKQMMMIMPLMFSAFMLFLPLGLVLYIFINTSTSVLQQWMYQKGIRWRDVLRGNFRVVV